MELTLTTPTDVVVDRSTWVCGDYSADPVGNDDKRHFPMGKSQMRNDQGNKCCLGFFGLACGIPEIKMTGHGLPWGIAGILDMEIPILTLNKFDTSFSQQAVNINDSEQIAQSKREERLTDHFAKAGVKLTFINEFPKEVLKLIKQRDAKFGK